MILSLCSLAGSERYEDSKAHSRQLMNESRDNNKALSTLKDCVRARAKAATEEGFVHIPYRTSRLTWVLKVIAPFILHISSYQSSQPIFNLEEARPSLTLVLAHVSPHIQDISHSTNTLAYAAPFRIVLPRLPPKPYDEADPRTWDHEHTIAWLQKEFHKAFEGRRREEWKKQREALKGSSKMRRLKARDVTDKPRVIELETFCWGQHGGTWLGKMYGSEWVARGLKAINPTLLDGNGDIDKLKAIVKEDTLNVYLSFSQTLLQARNKTRKSTLESRAPPVERPGMSSSLFHILF